MPVGVDVTPPGLDIVNAMVEAFEPVADAFGEMRRLLLDQGFSDEHAGQLVIETFRASILQNQQGGE